MAGIDKTYIHGKEYPIYRNWYIENYDKMIKELGEPIWFYTFSIFDPISSEDDYPEITPEFWKNNTSDIEYWKDRNDFPIWDTSGRIDKWLVKNCNIQSFRDTMLKVYGHKWIGFKDQEWIPKPNKKQHFS